MVDENPYTVLPFAQEVCKLRCGDDIEELAMVLYILRVRSAQSVSGGAVAPVWDFAIPHLQDIEGWPF